MHRDEELCTLNYLFLAFFPFSETSCHCRRLSFFTVKCEENACDVRRCIPIIFPLAEFPTHFSSLKSNSHLVVARQAPLTVSLCLFNVSSRTKEHTHFFRENEWVSTFHFSVLKIKETTQSVSSVSQSQIRLTFLTSRSHRRWCARRFNFSFSSFSLWSVRHSILLIIHHNTPYSRELAENREKAMFNMLNE